VPITESEDLVDQRTRRRLPFALGLLLAAFLLLFSFDVFEGDEPVYRQLLGFVVHSLPSITILLTLAYARANMRMAGWLFFVLAAVSIVLFHDPLGRLITALPMALIGALFISAARAERRAERQAQSGE
jgi:hypothetical protein